MGTEAQRAKLYTVVASHWGEEAADAMMAVVPPWDHAEVARKVDVDNARLELKADMAQLRGEFGELRGEFGELRGEFGELRGEFKSLMGRMIAVNTGMMFGCAGMVFAAAQFV